MCSKRSAYKRLTEWVWCGIRKIFNLAEEQEFMGKSRFQFGNFWSLQIARVGFKKYLDVLANEQEIGDD